jgi:hypothetical protein
MHGECVQWVVVVHNVQAMHRGYAMHGHSNMVGELFQCWSRLVTKENRKMQSFDFSFSPHVLKMSYSCR